MSGLVIDQIEAGYAGSTVLHGVSLSLRAGEFLAIIGPNGAGKSTLLRAISGLVRCRTGRIRSNGDDISRQSPEKIVRAGVAHVPEGRGIFSSLTVLENLKLGRWARAYGRGSADFELDDIFEMFPVLRNRQHGWAGMLSGGEQQMLAIGRAFLSDPRYLMIDEPSLGLAPKIVDQVYATLDTVRQKSGIGLLVVEQSIDRASAADRVMLMTGGQLRLLNAADMLSSGEERARAYFGLTAGASS